MINETANPSLREAIKRGWDWLVFVVQLISQVGGVKSWLRALGKLIHILRSHQQATQQSTQQPNSDDLSSFKSNAPRLEFYDSSNFPFVANLEANWQIIRQELTQLQGMNFIEYSEKFLYKSGWKTLGLYAFGIKIERNCELCPETTKLIEKIPNLHTAAFSSLEAGTHIIPHTGYPEQVLRCHLGLFVPDNCETRCGIRVGTQTRNWAEGKCLIFDDTFEHEAWNKSDRTRIVLLLDFKYSF
ncbi:aspartyl/asparaginyl beta-hydroxylase-like dioxygenase [Synechococcus sp. PCC 7502]|uniref:aspartyl/asparaginyl beta-hydroxylase domain-containing protein n=1 Tax=Synechococcus sp. PCC 7502 TaxID=1173263 RepID=UPI00029FBCA6|nr:aspartyl/asparaginyl beta-hydroxylase domain-containing protein [Synechococcus sp. PCC 7502]AFY73177.1 aspartyl/asparaginyl beta-hydroxylase-like dioxygenase [Synechococcus sp. PCC 7502]